MQPGQKGSNHKAMAEEGVLVKGIDAIKGKPTASS